MLTPASCASFLDSILSPIAAIALGGGPMKAILAFASALAKLSRSRQETVARMHRLGPGRLAGVDDQLGLEVAFAAGGGPSRTLSSAISTCGARASASE